MSAECHDKMEVVEGLFSCSPEAGGETLWRVLSAQAMPEEGTRPEPVGTSHRLARPGMVKERGVREGGLCLFKRLLAIG